MNPLADLSNSFRGWAEIVAGKPDAARYFRLAGSGLAIALGWLLAAVLLSAAVQSMGAGVPSLGAMALGLFAEALTVALLGVAMAQTLRFLKLGVPLSALWVPVLYALSYMFLLAIVVTLVAPAAGLIAILAAGYLIFRAGRALAGMSTSEAVGFASIAVIVLVVVPAALYIVFLQIPSLA